MATTQQRITRRCQNILETDGQVCGKRMTKYATECGDCYRHKRDKQLAAARAIVATGKCPQCGRGLKRNLSLAGWWQCEQYGAETFRKDPSQPSCSFQTFTE